MWYQIALKRHPKKLGKDQAHPEKNESVADIADCNLFQTFIVDYFMEKPIDCFQLRLEHLHYFCHTDSSP